MKRFALALLMASASFATIIEIDNFDTDQGPLTEVNVPGAVGSPTATASSGPLALNPFVSRTLTLTKLAASNPVDFNVEVSFGGLDITNGALEDSRVVVTYDINNLDLSSLSGPAYFYLNIVSSDANPTQIAVSGLANGVFNIPGNTFGLALAVPIGVAPASYTGPLVLTINGDTSWDMRIDSFGITDVPEPGTMLLLGAGLIGLGLRRRA